MQNLRNHILDGHMNTYHLPVNASREEQFRIGFERGFENALRASRGGLGWEEQRVIKDDSMVGE